MVARCLGNHHSKGEIVGHCKNTYCPLLYLNPWGLDIIILKTFPGSTETCCHVSQVRVSFNIISYVGYVIIHNLLDKQKDILFLGIGYSCCYFRRCPLQLVDIYVCQSHYLEAFFP